MILTPFLDLSSNPSALPMPKVAVPAVTHSKEVYFPPLSEEAPESIREAVLLGAEIAVARGVAAQYRNIGRGRSMRWISDDALTIASREA